MEPETIVGTLKTSEDVRTHSAGDRQVAADAAAIDKVRHAGSGVLDLQLVEDAEFADTTPSQFRSLEIDGLDLEVRRISGHGRHVRVEVVVRDREHSAFT